MSGLPSVLVIDDAYGASRNGRNRERKSFCYRTGLQDVTGDIDAELLRDPLANVTFCSGQKVIDNEVVNALNETINFIEDGLTNNSIWSLILLDLHFKTGILENDEPVGHYTDRLSQHYFGIEILRAIRNRKNLADLPVVVLSSMSRNDIEHDLSGLSASNFCDKSQIDRALMREQLEEQGLLTDSTIIGKSKVLLKCLRETRRRARHGGDNILLLGESGTGKELFANYAHRLAHREGEFVPLLTQSVPESLIEDQLFGHEKGAFDGANRELPGAAERADGGTLFIDEFGDVNSNVQVKLLRLLDNNIREVQRIGSDKVKKVDVQVVLATSRIDFLKSDGFRQDLLYRAGGMQDAITIPPLRERSSDIPILANYFREKFEKRFKAEKRKITDEAMELLCSYAWPGNVRELEKTIERAVINFRGLKVMSPTHLSLFDGSPYSSSLGSSEAIAQNYGGSESRSDRSSRAVVFQALLDDMINFSADSLSFTDLSGAISRIEPAQHILMCALLKKALLETRRFSLRIPEGEILIQPAMKLLTNNNDLSAVKAADLIKRLLKGAKNHSPELLNDPVLSVAYEKALSLRPTSPTAKRIRSSKSDDNRRSF